MSRLSCRAFSLSIGQADLKGFGLPGGSERGRPLAVFSGSILWANKFLPACPRSTVFAGVWKTVAEGKDAVGSGQKEEATLPCHRPVPKSLVPETKRGRLLGWEGTRRPSADMVPAVEESLSESTCIGSKNRKGWGW